MRVLMSDHILPVPRNNILLKAARGYQVIDVRTIVLIEADERYCRATLLNDTTRPVFHTLAEMERFLCVGERLGELLFLRTHRSTIAAFHHAVGYDRRRGMQLIGGLVAPISREQRAAILSIAGAVRHRG